MNTRIVWIAILTVISCFLVAGCGELGKVDQGRVIAFEKEKGIVTLIQDKKAEPGNPDYNTLPPHSYSIPTDPMEMGAEPKAGKRMKLDTKKNQIVIFDDATQNFKTIDYTLIEQKEGVRREDPLVKDKKFPIVVREGGKKTITVYSARQRIYTVFSVPDEYYALPDNTWDAGDEVRLYYKEEGKALRLMNISKTDIYKK